MSGAAADNGPGGRPGGLKLIACPAVLGELADGATDGVDCGTLEAQLHLSPERLKEALRAAVADADKPGATIVLGYGLCSNAVLGLKTEHATLVVPRVDDCIAMMLGSNEAFAARVGEGARHLLRAPRPTWTSATRSSASTRSSSRSAASSAPSR